jgi:hypothetical protein
MGNFGARSFGLEKAFQTVEESVDGLVKLVSFIATITRFEGPSFCWQNGVADFG